MLKTQILVARKAFNPRNSSSVLSQLMAWLEYSMIQIKTRPRVKKRIMRRPRFLIGRIPGRDLLIIYLLKTIKKMQIMIKTISQEIHKQRDNHVAHLEVVEYNHPSPFQQLMKPLIIRMNPNNKILNNWQITFYSQMQLQAVFSSNLVAKITSI